MGSFMTVRKFADEIGMSRATVYKLVKDKVIKVLRRPGCHIRIPESELQRYVEVNTCPASTTAPPSSGSQEDGTGTSRTGSTDGPDASRHAAHMAGPINRT